MLRDIYLLYWNHIEFEQKHHVMKKDLMKFATKNDCKMITGKKHFVSALIFVIVELTYYSSQSFCSHFLLQISSNLFSWHDVFVQLQYGFITINTCLSTFTHPLKNFITIEKNSLLNFEKDRNILNNCAESHETPH